MHPDDLSRINTILHSDHVAAFVEIDAPPGALTQQDLHNLHARISTRLKSPVNLKVQTLLTDEVELNDINPPGGARSYRADDILVPRR